MRFSTWSGFDKQVLLLSERQKAKDLTQEKKKKEKKQEKTAPMGYKSPYSPRPLWPTRALTPDGLSSMGTQQGSQGDGSQDHDLGPAHYVFKVHLQRPL